MNPSSGRGSRCTWPRLAGEQPAAVPLGAWEDAPQRRSLHTTLRCKATGGADRRDVLLGLGGAAAAGLLTSSSRRGRPPHLPDTVGVDFTLPLLASTDLDSWSADLLSTQSPLLVAWTPGGWCSGADVRWSGG